MISEKVKVVQAVKGDLLMYQVKTHLRKEKLKKKALIPNENTKEFQIYILRLFLKRLEYWRKRDYQGLGSCKRGFIK